MAKVRNTRKARSVKPANAPALALTFDAHIDVDAQSNSTDEIINNELCIIENAGDASEADILDCYTQALAQAFMSRMTHAQTSDTTRDWLAQDARATFAGNVIVKQFFDARVMPDVLTHRTSGDRMFCVKTYRRALDVVNFVTGARRDLNNQAQAIFESLVRFERAGKAFAYKHAFAACNADRTFSPEIEVLMSHTKNYGESTQKRQSGMSLNALVMLNAVHKSGACYTVNPDSAIAQTLIAKLAL